jgi:hypothetical protein
MDIVTENGIAGSPLLDTESASAYLSNAHGVSYTPATLCKLRTIGGGPVFHKIRARVRYSATALDQWATEMRGPARRSTADYGSAAA